MNRSIMRATLSVLATLSITLAGSAAHAEPDTVSRPEPANERRVSLLVSPLPMLFGRYGFDVHYLARPHLALTANAFILSLSDKGPDDRSKERLDGGGAELGVRLYSGSHGPRGLFVGSALLFGRYAQARDLYDQQGDRLGRVTTLGVALDVGGQHVFDSGVTVAAGVGVQLMRPVDGDIYALTTAPWFDGIAPRALVSTGYTF